MEMSIQHCCDGTDRGQQKYSEGNIPNGISATRNHSFAGWGWNKDLRSERPVAGRESHGSSKFM